MSRIIYQVRRNSPEMWAMLNPILLDGEQGVEESDTNPRMKIGDGNARWNDLPYLTSESEEGAISAEEFDAHVADFDDHIVSLTPHPVYDSGPSLFLLYENAKV